MRMMQPITATMVSMPTAIYFILTKKDIGEKFIVLLLPYIKKFKMRPPAITEAI